MKRNLEVIFLRFLVWSFFAALVASCANPKYATTESALTGIPEQKTERCQAKFTSGHCVTMAWEKLPTEEDFGAFLFKVYRANRVDGSAVLEDLDGTLAVVLWMPSMGHGASPVKVERLDVGTYRASNVFFTMRGQWEIRFQLKHENEIKDQAILPYSP